MSGCRICVARSLDGCVDVPAEPEVEVLFFSREEQGTRVQNSTGSG